MVSDGNGICCISRKMIYQGFELILDYCLYFYFFFIFFMAAPRMKDSFCQKDRKRSDKSLMDKIG